jgi:hypothetical protein
MGAAANGFKSTILTDHVVSRGDGAGNKPASQYKSELGELHRQIIDRPQELADSPTKSAYAGDKIFSPAEKKAIRENVHIGSLKTSGGRVGSVFGFMIPPLVGAAIGAGAYLGTFDIAHAKEEGEAAAGDTGYILGGSQPGFPRSSLYKAMDYALHKADELMHGSKPEPNLPEGRLSLPIAKP